MLKSNTLEGKHTVEALIENHGNIKATAKALGVSRPTIYNRLDKPAVRLALARALERAGAGYDEVAQHLARALKAKVEDPDNYDVQHRAADTILRLVGAYPDPPASGSNVQVNVGHNPYLSSPLASEPDAVLSFMAQHGRAPTDAERATLEQPQVIDIVEVVGDTDPGAGGDSNANPIAPDGTLP